MIGKPVVKIEQNEVVNMLAFIIDTTKVVGKPAVKIEILCKE